MTKTRLAVAVLLVGCCATGGGAHDAGPPARAHAGARWIASPTGGSWVWCDLQPIPSTGSDVAANALRCQLVDRAGYCEAWSTYVHADFAPIDAVPAITRACVTRVTAPSEELVEHGRIELRCGDEVPLLWFCQLGRCLGPVPMVDDPSALPPTLVPQLSELGCDVDALR